MLSSCQAPIVIQEALADPRWVQAIKLEMKALEKNKTWTFVSLLKEKQTIGFKWVFTIKHR